MNHRTSLLLKIITGDEEREISLPDEIIKSAEPLLARMDDDMDGGWQIGRQYVSTPDRLQRCQVAADRLLSALHTDNQASITVMCAYILTRLNGVATVSINIEGEPGQTSFYDNERVRIA